MRSLRLALALLLIPALAWGQGLPIKSGATTDLMTVDTNKNARTNYGVSTRVSYIASASALTAATAHTLSIESSSSTGFKLVAWCVSISNATAASSVAVVVQRRTTASAGGTALTNEGTATPAISKMDPAAANFTGIARLDGTPGTAGAIVDQQQLQIGIIATGAGSERPLCRYYGGQGEQMPTVSAGTASGLSIAVPSLGAGSQTTSIQAVIIQE